MNIAKVSQTWLMLRVTYALVPILVGLDKCFTGLIVDWSKYVSPVIMGYLPLTLGQLLLLVGVIEIIAGVVVWFYPRMGAYIVVAWMILIILDLASMNAFYDIIARDVVIAIGALALAWLTEGLQV